MHTSTYIITEAGVNHNGSEDIARQLIDIAADAKADAVKFQLFDPAALTTASAKTAAYQAANLNDGAISQRAMLEKLCLPEGAFVRLEAYCNTRGIDFICTPFDAASLHYLVTHTRMPYLKLPSGEVTNGPFLHACARTGLPIILSTGMADLGEVAVALSILHAGYHGVTPPRLLPPTPEMLRELSGKVTILHCVSQYPAPVESLNLSAIDTLRDAFGLPVGYSDHSLGITMPIAAVAKGAVMIEKHFTFDVHAEGPDHKASLTAEELAAMVRAIRDTQAARGDGKKQCQPAEMSTREVVRKSIVAATAIRQGELFSEANLTCKRPGTGISPNALWQLIGKPASRDYDADSTIDTQELTAHAA